MTTPKKAKQPLAFLCVFALGLLAGGFFSHQYDAYKTIQTAEATTQLCLEGMDFCDTLGLAMAGGDQETLLACYQEEGRSDLALRGYLAQRLSIFNGLPLTYASCQENTRRYASPTSYSGTYDLFFQVNGPLPASFQARIPGYTVQAIQATGTMTVTIQISREEDTPWSYSLFSVEDIAI